MTDVKPAVKFIFIEECPGLKRKVILERQTWENHILKESNHTEMIGKIPVVKKAIQSLKQEDFLRYKHYSKGRCFAHYSCFHFVPKGKYLRLTFKIINDEIAYMTSAMAVDAIPTMGVEKYGC